MRQMLACLVPALLAVLLTAGSGLADVPPGSRGYGETVFLGETVDRFDVEILGTVHGWGGTGDIILARLAGASLEQTGVLQGMSGSPVWIDGELIGAVMSTWPFAKEAIAGIRPIAEMRALEASLDEADRSRGAPGGTDAGAPMTQMRSPAGYAGTMPADPGEDHPPFDLLRWLDGAAGSAPAAAEAAPEPLGELPLRSNGLLWTASGFTPDLRGQMERRLSAPVVVGGGARRGQAPAGGTDGTDLDPSATLEPGDAMAVLLIDGDAQLAAVGTVTERDGDTVLGFGHPFLGLGPVSMPLAKARVVAVLPSQQMSFKIAESTRRVGALLLDRRAGVSGRLGVKADVLPVRVQLMSGDQPEREFHFEVARVKTLLPDLAVWTVVNSLLDNEQLGGENTLDLRLSLAIEGGDPLRTKASLSGSDIASSLADEIKLPVMLATSNPDRPLRIERLDVELDLHRGLRAARLGRVIADPPRPEPGDDVHVRVEILPYRQRSTWLDLTLTIPPQIRSGRVGIHVGDGGSAFRDDITRAPARWQYLGVRQIRDALALREPASTLVATLYGPSRSTVVRGVELDQLPGSVQWVMSQRQGMASQEPVAATLLDRTRLPTQWVLQGSEQILLEIETKEGSHDHE